jgi:hypothetical protein
VGLIHIIDIEEVGYIHLPVVGRDGAPQDYLVPYVILALVRHPYVYGIYGIKDKYVVRKYVKKTHML